VCYRVDASRENGGESSREHADNGRTDKTIEGAIGNIRRAKSKRQVGGQESREGSPEKRQLHLPVEQFVDLECEGLLVDDSVVGLDQLTIGGKEVCPWHSEATQIGDHFARLIEVMDEGEIELIEKQPRPSLAVVVVETDEIDAVAELGVGSLQQRCLCPAGETPRSPHVDDSRPIEVSKELLEGGAIDLG
jgi:hypothetical protein